MKRRWYGLILLCMFCASIGGEQSSSREHDSRGVGITRKMREKCAATVQKRLRLLKR